MKKQFGAFVFLLASAIFLAPLSDLGRALEREGLPLVKRVYAESRARSFLASFDLPTVEVGEFLASLHKQIKFMETAEALDPSALAPARKRRRTISDPVELALASARDEAERMSLPDADSSGEEARLSSFAASFSTAQARALLAMASDLRESNAARWIALQFAAWSAWDGELAQKARALGEFARKRPPTNADFEDALVGLAAESLAELPAEIALPALRSVAENATTTFAVDRAARGVRHVRGEAPSPERQDLASFALVFGR